MNIYYNLADRKPFVKALEEITGAKAVYMRTPTYAYTVDYFTVTREGNLTFHDMADSEEVEYVLKKLEQRGYSYEKPLEDCPPIYGGSEGLGLTVSVPLDKVLVGNLTNLLEAKSTLIKKALDIRELPIIVDEEKVSFPWFTEVLDADTVKTYTDFIAALCKMSRKQKRILSTEKPAENEKYAFRCFLLRLGFIGEAYKADRKILLKNLKGSSAFKTEKEEVVNHEISE